MIQHIGAAEYYSRSSSIALILDLIKPAQTHWVTKPKNQGSNTTSIVEGWIPELIFFFIYSCWIFLWFIDVWFLIYSYY